MIAFRRPFAPNKRPSITCPEAVRYYTASLYGPAKLIQVWFRPGIKKARQTNRPAG
jgi:hypothetical protein